MELRRLEAPFEPGLRSALDAFDCGNEQVNGFLQPRRASGRQRLRAARTPSPAGRLLGVEPRERAGARFATSAHLATGVSLGAVRGLLDLVGVRGAPAAFFWIVWTPDLVVVPAAGAAEPPWRWGTAEVAISAAHHAVYAAAGESAYRWLAAG